jgi:hypothetical protein
MVRGIPWSGRNAMSMEAVSMFGLGLLVLGVLGYALYCLIRYPESRKTTRADVLDFHQTIVPPSDTTNG